MASSKPKTNALAWKHIGLYGHSIGTFKADPAAIQWKSTILDDDNILISRLLPASSLTSSLWTVFGRSAHLRIQTKGEEKNLPGEMRFDGFPSSDYEKIRSTLRSLYDIDCLKHTMSSSGASFGKTDVAGRHLVFRQCIMDEEEEEGEDGDEMMSLALGEVSQCVLPGNTRNEIELQFHESDAVEAGTDQLVSIRLYIPPDAEADANDAEQATSAELFRERIVTMANVKNTTGSVIAEFDESKGTFLTPRGRYNIELFDSFLRMRGNKYDYKIKYDDISRLFLLPKPDDVHMAFVIALDRPIRQGQQRYQYLVLQTTKQQSEVSISLDAETLERDYNNDLQPVMTGSLSNLVAKTFKVITRKKVFVPGKIRQLPPAGLRQMRPPRQRGPLVPPGEAIHLHTQAQRAHSLRRDRERGVPAVRRRGAPGRHPKLRPVRGPERQQRGRGEGVRLQRDRSRGLCRPLFLPGWEENQD